MIFAEFQRIISPNRMRRYVAACKGDTRKAMSLYRANLQLSQEVFVVLSCFEVSLRNAINQKLTAEFGNDWLRDAGSIGGIFDNKKCSRTFNIISKAYSKLKKEGDYSHDKLIAEMEFGIWKYMFSKPQYLATRQKLLKIFPNKPRSSAAIQYNNVYFYNELDGINILRNRIAHHEPICFSRKLDKIDTTYVLNAYDCILRLFNWMDIDSRALLYGLDHIKQACRRIEELR